MTWQHFESSGSQAKDALKGILCEDGSLGGFHFLPSSTSADQDKWLFWFEGGANPTSTNWGETEEPISKFFGPEFDTWNQVYFRTCSSDFRAGRRLTPLDGKYHQGHLGVVNGMNAILAWTAEHPETEASTVLIGGCSGGGWSQVINLDYMASRFPEGADVRAWINSGLHFDIAPYSDFIGETHLGEIPFISKEEAESMNVFVDESCRAALGEDWHKCIGFDHAFAHISTKAFISQSMYDKIQLGLRLGLPKTAFISKDVSKWATNTTGYMAYFGKRSRDVFVSAVEANADAALWMPSCFNHCEATLLQAPEQVTTKSGQSYTAKEAFQAWYWQQGASKERLYVDSCADELPCNAAADPQNKFMCTATAVCCDNESIVV
jgi:hypothetical protein